MYYMPSPPIDRNAYKQVSFGVVLTISIAFHILMIVVIPLLSQLVLKSTKFQRPQTFQLVSIPTPNQIRHSLPVEKPKTKQQVAQKEKKSEPTPVPSSVKKPSAKDASKKKEAAAPEENLSELESLLDEIPAPAKIAQAGTGKFNWYLQALQDKIQRYWSPPTENREQVVIVAFKVFQDGNISEPQIQKSSGNVTLDNLALQAVKRAAPFGRIPVGLTPENRYDCNITLRSVRN